MDSNSAGPLIAIVGSVDDKRTDYDPKLEQVPVALKAAEELGRELAKAGCRIIVYSSEEEFIEKRVVSGYVASNQAQALSIQMRYPSDYKPAFPEQKTHDTLFEPHPDTHADWERSFYWSLKDAQGILVIGGGHGALILGIVSRAYRIPLITVATFGGAAQALWASLDPRTDVVTETERNIMNPPTWNEGSAKRMVDILLAQRQRLLAEAHNKRRTEKLQEMNARKRSTKAGVLFLMAVVLTAIGLFAEAPHPLLFAFCFLLTPLLAGSAGGIVSTIYDPELSKPEQTPRPTQVAGILGMIAGMIASLTFVLAQLATHPEIKSLAQAAQSDSGLSRLVPFGLIIGFIAGFTLEAVFGKFKRTDVVDLSTVTTRSQDTAAP